MTTQARVKTLIAVASLGFAFSSGLSAQINDQEEKSTKSTVWESFLGQGQSLLDRAPDNLELSVAGGVRFEDNLVVESIDIVSAEKDVALVGELNLDYKDDIWKDTRLRTGYSLSQRLFRQEDEFNLQSHYGFVDLSRNLSEVTAGTVVDIAYASIGGNSLLNKQGISGYLSDLTTENAYWRASAGFDQTHFDRDSGRSNIGQHVDFSGFYFIDGPRQYFTFDYRYNQEQADSSVYDYYFNRIKLGYVRRLTLADNRPVRVRLDWRYELRRYENLDPILNAKRRDDRGRWRIRMDTPISKNVSFQLKYEHRNYSSNNASLDFNDNRIEVLVELQLL